MSRYFRYALLYHRNLLSTGLVVSGALLFPVYVNGLRALPTEVLAKVCVMALIIGLHHRRPHNNAVFFMNMNLDVRYLLLTYLLLDTALFLLAACLVLILT